MSKSARTRALTAILLAGLAADAIAQVRGTPVGLQCGPHTGRPDDGWTQGPGTFWNASCRGEAACNLVARAHDCKRHGGPCDGVASSSTEAAIIDIVADGVGRAVASLPNDQAAGALLGLGLLAGLVNSSANDSAANAAAVAEQQRRAAQLAAEKRARDTRLAEDLSHRLKGFNTTNPAAGPPPPDRPRVKLGDDERRIPGSFGTANSNPIQIAGVVNGFRDVSSPMKQLLCANDLAGRASKATSGLDDILFFSQEAGAALEGVAFGAGCSGSLTAVASPEGVSAYKEELRGALTELAAAAAKVKQPPADATGNGAELRRALEQARVQTAALVKPTPEAVARAAEQARIDAMARQTQATEAAQRRKAEEVFAEQKRLEREREARERNGPVQEVQGEQ